MHRHPRSAKILYLLKGQARVLGPTGTPPMKADEGTAIFLPAGYPHVIENMARQADAVLPAGVLAARARAGLPRSRATRRPAPTSR